MYLSLFPMAIRDIDIVIVRDSFPGRITGGPRAIKIIFNRILSALRFARICPGGNWNDAGIQMILGAKCPIVKLKTIQGTSSSDLFVRSGAEREST